MRLVSQIDGQPTKLQSGDKITFRPVDGAFHVTRNGGMYLLWADEQPGRGDDKFRDLPLRGHNLTTNFRHIISFISALTGLVIEPYQPEVPAHDLLMYIVR